MSGMSGIRFESAWEKAKERDALREAREQVLEKAKARAEVDRVRKQKEESWMLPDLDRNLGHKSSSKKKKKEKKKKHKKEKKKKKKKERKRSSSSSSSSSRDEDEWVEKSAKASTNQDDQNNVPKRQEWMELGELTSKVESKDRPSPGPSPDPLSLALSRTSTFDDRHGLETKKQKERRIKEEENRKKQMQRELNPNLTDGSNERSANSDRQAKVGDGGASWLRRAFKRAQEQAAAQGKTIEEIAADRWGSLENFQKLLAKAEGKVDERRSRSRSPSAKHHNHRRSRSSSRERERARTSKDLRRFARPSGSEETKESSRSLKSSATRGSWKTTERIEKERKEAFENQMKLRKRSRSSSSSDSRSRSPEVKKEIQAQQTEEVMERMSEKQMNMLGAKILKAEMMGNNELAERLKLKLEKAKAVAASAEEAEECQSKITEKEMVTLTRTDNKGMVRPVLSTGSDSKPDQGRKRGKKGQVNTHGNDGKRVRYFADDDKYDIKQMFEREKLSTAEDQNAMLSRLAGKAIEKTDDDYDIDEVFTKRASHKEKIENLERDKEKAIAEHQRMAKVLDNCSRCLGTAKKHLMIAMGDSCYLALPEYASLTDGHCFIIPFSHVTCARQLDEDVWNEIQDFRKALVKMFSLADDSDDEPEDCVFFETALRLKQGRHMVIECVPIPVQIGEVAPMYFQKAIQECESEWSNNKKLIDLRGKGLRRSVPKGLPYFHVDFGLSEGFAHVVEDEDLFPANFAHEIIGGMLDLDPVIWRGHKKERFEEQKAKVLKFGAKWKKVDFTKKKQSSDSSSSDSD